MEPLFYSRARLGAASKYILKQRSFANTRDTYTRGAGSLTQHDVRNRENLYQRPNTGHPASFDEILIRSEFARENNSLSAIQFFFLIALFHFGLLFYPRLLLHLMHGLYTFL